MNRVGARRRRVLATVALAVLIVAVPLGVYAWGRSSGTFRVDRIVVSGARPAHARAVRLVLRRRFLGANLFTVTAARVRATLAGFPYVDQVAVDRDFPDTLKVRVTEFVPAALLRSDDRWYVVSTEGRVLAEATTTAAPGSASSAPSATSSPAPGSAGAGVSPAATQSPAAGATGVVSPSPAGQGSPAASPSPSPSSTSLPQPAANVVLPRGTRELPVIVTDTPVTVGGTVADPDVRDALTVLAALPRTLRRAARGVSATDISIRVYLGSGRHGRVRRHERTAGQNAGPRGCAQPVPRTPGRLHVRGRVGARPAAGRSAAGVTSRAGGHTDDHAVELAEEHGHRLAEE